LKEEKEKLPVDETKQSGEVTRRDFLVGAGTVVVGGAIGAGMLSSCSDGETKTVTTTKTVDKVSTVTIGEGTPITVTETATIGEGQTVTSTVTSTTTVGGVEPWQEPEETTFHNGFMAAHGFGGAPAAYDSKNGKLIRIRGFDYTKDYPEFKTFTREGRNGKNWSSFHKTRLIPEIVSYKQRVYNSKRIKYPLQRVDWEPGGDPEKINSQNRGKSKFKRISWDEAAKIVASELKRIQEKYGNSAILPGLTGHGETKFIHNNQMMSAYLIDCQLGTENGRQYTDCYFTIPSVESSIYGAAHVWGANMLGQEPQTGVPDSVAQNTEMVLEWASDPLTHAWFQHGSEVCTYPLWWREIGIKAVYVCPDFNTSAAVLADKWIPVITNTDAALFLAIAYTWIDEDIYDKDYIDTHAYGFDDFKAYVMGDEDGVPKTPAWASPICGVPIFTIKALAREWASKVTSISHGMDGGSISRGVYSTEPRRLEALCLGMQGLGRPGVHQIASMMGWGAVTSIGQPSLTAMGAWRAPNTMAALAPALQHFLADKLPECILNPTTSWYGTVLAPSPEGQTVKYTFPEPGQSKIHMIWYERSYLGSYSAGPKILEAYRSPEIEFNLRQEMHFEGDSSYADIILPITTQAEQNDINYSTSGCQALYVTRKACEPIGEALADDEAIQLVARELGCEDKFTQGKTEEDWIDYAFSTSGAQNDLSLEEFKERGYFVRSHTFQLIKPSFEEFYENPEDYPLMTPSGLLEFKGQVLAEHFPDDQERAPVPHYVAGGPASEGWTHDESLSGTKAEMYPLVCESSPSKFRIHTMSDDVAWMREIYKIKGPDGYMYEACWLHPDEAAARNIKHGDIVKVYNDRAAILCGAYVTERVQPKSLHLEKGSSFDQITINFDRGGCSAMLAPQPTISKNCGGYTLSGYLVEVEKANLDELRMEYPEAFSRAYDPAHGVGVDAWIEGGND
jgi:trimethylamine-N-oxide reductase (cytochrome c)